MIIYSGMAVESLLTELCGTENYRNIGAEKNLFQEVVYYHEFNLYESFG